MHLDVSGLMCVIFFNENSATSHEIFWEKTRGFFERLVTSPNR